MHQRRTLFYYLGNHFDFFFFGYKSLFFFKGRSGLVAIKLPSLYYYRSAPLSFSLGFQHKHFFSYFLHFFLFMHHRVCFFFKLKLRGLGYRIKAIASKFFRFFVGTTNFYFLHTPLDILVRVRRRRMLLVSRDKSKLNLVVSHLLLLKRIIPYGLRGLFFPRQIILLKPGKKKF